ncbi:MULTISPECIES: histidine phosphatase family protein [unclassified Nostoc]|uniref:histidine phosphatase family protein n=1 Tax=unclassified Nostoc TaxID=2593658 RepID=UPI0025AA9430|nr:MULTISPECIES: histidine phosphatase family protein [unclassified Nostoc]MDM9580699.1 histidine phosphatase family protein [Nostoc sp. GT001]MDZ7947161.1 histidine phosphatase family protein [Nostoc sp. EfeVER01]MDZ7994696.1 histidine phosphatase family protein [Nostoc sp. EspVER01]
MSLTLYFLRHGQTECSRNNSFCGSIDSELTPEGLEMAKAFADAYTSKDWTAIFCSPMQRTVLTAKPLYEAIGIEPQLRDGLKEINYGLWEGKTPEVIMREYHDDYIRWSADPAWNAPSGGEMAVTIAYRALQVIEEIKQNYSSGNVLVVSHKATIRIILCSLLGIDVGRFRFRLGCPVASVSIVEFTSHGTLLKVLADRSHLDERLRNLPGT